MKPNICLVTLKELGIRFTEPQLLELIKNRPYMHTFWGISSVLNQYNIKTEGVRYQDIDEVPECDLPMICRYNDDMVLVQINEHNPAILKISDEQGNVTYQSSKDFCPKWDKTALLIDYDGQSEELNYKINRKNLITKKLKYYILSALTIILFTLTVICNPNDYLWWSISLINLLGILVSFLLLQKQLHIPNSFTSKLCGLSKSGDCDDVLQSNAATLGGIIKLSEIGFSFFFVNQIVITLFPATLQTLSLFLLLALPFTFWSIWYQTCRVRSRCVLCLCVLALIWLEFFAFLFAHTYTDIHFSLLNFISLAITYVSSAILVNIVMALIANAREGGVWNQKFNVLKYNQSVIKILQDSNEYIACEDSSSIIFGDDNAPNEVTIFSNPFCSPCADLHKSIHSFPNKVIKIRYVMTFFSGDKSIINKYFIAAYLQLGKERTWDLLFDWFNGGKLLGSSFFDGLNLMPDTPNVTEEFNKQTNWIKSNRIEGTPTILYKGHPLKWPYDFNDLTMM